MRLLSLALIVGLLLPLMGAQEVVTARRRSPSGGGGSASFTLSCQQSSTSTTGGVPQILTAISTTGAKSVVVAVASFNVITSVTDSAGNGAASFLTGGVGNSPNNQFFYWNSPTTSGSDIITINTSGSPGLYSSACVFVISGTTGAYYNSAFNQCGSNASTCQGGSFSGSGHSPVIAISCYGAYPTTGTPSISSSFTGLQYVLGSSGTAFSEACAGLVQTSGSSVNPTWTQTNGASTPTAINAAFY